MEPLCPLPAPKGRQVCVEGRVEEITPAEADAYWPTRPRQSRLAATASHQSARRWLGEYVLIIVVPIGFAAIVVVALALSFYLS